MEKLGFTNWSQSSRIGAIGKVTSAYLIDLWSTLAELERQVNPSTARGQFLDRIGEQFGVKRRGSTVASTVSQGPVVKFTNNGVSSVTIPASTRVWVPSDPDLAYLTAQAVQVAAGGEGFADVTSIGIGDAFNIGANQIGAHNMGDTNVTVTNVRPIGGGSIIESDASYRFRILQTIQARNGSTETAITQAALSVPGIKSVVINPGVRGNGSIDVIVVPISQVVTPAILSRVESEISQVIAAGISWRVLAPVNKRINVTVQLKIAPSNTLANIKALVDSSIRGYIDNLRINDGNPGSTFIYNELVSRIMDASSDIIDSSVVVSLDGIQFLQTNLSNKSGERFVTGAVSIK